ncbi:hypothetical protein JCM9279_005664 [Rhodotorula babjevae]
MDSPTARASSRKRTATSLAADDNSLDAPSEHMDEQPAKKKRAPRSTAAEKQAKKVARMERNRLAAQVSRDKKRQEAELLAKRVAELEAQLVDSPATAPSTSSLSASPSFALPPIPASFTTALSTATATPRDALVERLQDENESLKTQLALEQLQSQSLQIRLSSLEAKFGRLEQLLSHASDNVHEEQAQHGQVQQHEQEGALDSTAPAAQVLGSMETDSSRLVAREDDFSLPRKLSRPSFLPLDLDALLGFDFGAASLDAPVAAPDPVVDHGPVAGEHLPDDLVAQAWVDWASALDPAALEASGPDLALAAAPPPPLEQEHEFDLFEFLRQDAAPEAVC